MKRIWILILWLVPWQATVAQTTGSCAPAVGEAYLDVGNVRARILNNGNLFWRGSPAVYEVPKGSGQHAIFTANLWVGGLVADSLRIAAARYGNFEFWAGPLDALGKQPADCGPYDYVATLYHNDIEYYEQTGYVSHRLSAWPHTWGAPVVDGDGDPTNYDVASGDRPELLGDQMLWWVMNDVGNAHRSTDSPPLGLQVSGSAFAFNTLGAVGNTTFYRYRLHYKGHAPLDSAYVTLFLDTDLGAFDDDYIGSDTTLGMGYTYNAFTEDRKYGTAPPALGLSFLQGPRALPDHLDNDRDGDVDEAGERLGTTSVAYFYSSPNIQGDPTLGVGYYNYMRARWRNGWRFTFGGDALSYSNEPTAFVYPGDPVTHSFWSELNADNQGSVNAPGNRRFMVTTGPFRMEPGGEEEVVLAIVWSRGSSNLDSVRKLREDMAYIQSITPELLEPRIPASKAPARERPLLGYHHNYPNPFSLQTTIRYSLEQPDHVTLTVYDMLGREVAMLVDADQEVGGHEVLFDVAGLPAGAYVYRLQVGWAVATETMVVMP